MIKFSNHSYVIFGHTNWKWCPDQTYWESVSQRSTWRHPHCLSYPVFLLNSSLRSLVSQVLKCWTVKSMQFLNKYLACFLLEPCFVYFFLQIEIMWHTRNQKNQPQHRHRGIGIKGDAKVPAPAFATSAPLHHWAPAASHLVLLEIISLCFKSKGHDAGNLTDGCFLMCQQYFRSL